MKEINVGRKQGGGALASSPCAACKLLRRRCSRDCIFAPHFPADEPHKFASVHKVFGASNVSKMLQELSEHRRSDAVSAMVYEAKARVRDPVYGCVGAISSLQHQVDVLQAQLALAQAEVVQLRMLQFSNGYGGAPAAPVLASTSFDDQNQCLSTSTAPNNNNNNYYYNSVEFESSSSISSRTLTAMDSMILDDHHVGFHDEDSLWSASMLPPSISCFRF